MKSILVTAFTEEAAKIIQSKDKTDRTEKATQVLFGIKEEVISENPLIIRTTIKRNMPKFVFDQIIPALNLKFIEKGAKADEFGIEVED